MGTLPIIADTFRVALNWTGTGSQHAVNVIHLHSTSLSIANVAAAMDSNVTQTMWANVVSTCVVSHIDVTKLDGSSASYTLAVTGAKWSGGDGTGDFIPAAACVVSFKTGLRGRSRRGRIYLPFQAELNASNGSITASLAAANTAWSTFITAMNTAGAQLVVASYKLGDQQPVTSALVESVLATQRKRQSRLR